MILPEIDPIALQIGPIAIRWYSLTWIAAFFTIYYLLSKRSKNLNSEKVSALLFYGIMGAKIGGRCGYLLFSGTDRVVF
jgi:Prolipoprotein diacylglyceryltransferase